MKKLSAKQQHEKWLAKRGLTNISQKRKELGSPYSIPSYKIPENYILSNKVPENGTKNGDISKATFSKKNYATAPAYNKGPVMLVTKEDLKNGVGKR